MSTATGTKLCGDCHQPITPGHKRWCARCLPFHPQVCSTPGCQTKLPRRADGASQQCDPCRDQLPLDLGVTPVAKPRRGTRPPA